MIVPVPPPVSGTPVAETVYGDVAVRAEQTGGGTVTHGYAEYRFVVSNRGSAQRTVEIVAPATRFNFAPGSISRLSRAVVLAPGTSATISLFQPSLHVSGHGAEVTIDGVRQPQHLQFAPVYASGPMLKILTSRAVSDAELRTALQLILRPEEFELVTATTEVREWSGNWLALSPWDAIVVTRDEIGRADAEVRLAVDRFTRTGGVLVVLGAEPSQCAVQIAWADDVAFCAHGFGVKASVPHAPVQWTLDHVKALTDEIRGTQDPLKPWGASGGAIHPTRGPDFAVVEELSVPLRGLFIGMILFAVAAGPLNIMVLSKMNRRIWIIWTLPAIALVTSALVIVFATFSEGWVRAARADTITWIDADTREATTIGWTGYYATVAPGDGLRFDSETELHPFGGSRANVLAIDWTSGQHLSSGWISSRVTSVFRVRKSAPVRERLTFRRSGNGLAVTNGLGANVQEIWVADERGVVWTARAIDAGGTKVLERSPVGAPGTGSARALYKGDWLKATDVARRAPGALIRPGSWIAIVDGAPFVEDAMKGIRTRTGESVVMSELRMGDAE